MSKLNLQAEIAVVQKIADLIRKITAFFDVLKDISKRYPEHDIVVGRAALAAHGQDNSGFRWRCGRKKGIVTFEICSDAIAVVATAFPHTAERVALCSQWRARRKYHRDRTVMDGCSSQ